MTSMSKHTSITGIEVSNCSFTGNTGGECLCLWDPCVWWVLRVCYDSGGMSLAFLPAISMMENTTIEVSDCTFTGNDGSE